MSWLANSLQTQETLPKRMWVLGTEIFTRDLVPRFSRRNSEDFPFNSPPLSHSFHAPDVASEEDLNSSREHRLYSLPLGKDHSHSLEEKMVPLQPCLTSPSSRYRLGIFSSIQGTPLDPSLATNTQPRSNFQRFHWQWLPQSSYLNGTEPSERSNVSWILRSLLDRKVICQNFAVCYVIYYSWDPNFQTGLQQRNQTIGIGIQKWLFTQQHEVPRQGLLGWFARPRSCLCSREIPSEAMDVTTGCAPVSSSQLQTQTGTHSGNVNSHTGFHSLAVGPAPQWQGSHTAGMCSQKLPFDQLHEIPTLWQLMVVVFDYIDTIKDDWLVEGFINVHTCVRTLHTRPRIKWS